METINRNRGREPRTARNDLISSPSPSVCRPPERLAENESRHLCRRLGGILICWPSSGFLLARAALAGRTLMNILPTFPKAIIASELRTMPEFHDVLNERVVGDLHNAARFMTSEK